MHLVIYSTITAAFSMHPSARLSIRHELTS